MQFIKVKTRALIPPKDDLYAAMDAAMPKLREGDIDLITSKVVSIHQGRCVSVSDIPDKDKLILKEAEAFIPRNRVPHGWAVLTIKRHTLIPSSGIDESYANGHYILWPRNINKTARAAYESFKEIK